jgi:hypothetical protein
VPGGVLTHHSTAFGNYFTTLLLAAWVQSLYKNVALDLRSVRSLAKLVWVREAYPHQGVMVAARRSDSGPGQPPNAS